MRVERTPGTGSFRLQERIYTGGKMKKRSVLIIDDEDSIRRTISLALQEAGFQTDTAANGEEAVRRFTERAYDVLILDLKLPGLSGVDVLGEARARRPDMPVVIITAYGDVESAVASLRGGATNFIQKPFTPERIQEAALEALNRQHQIARESWYDDHVRQAAIAIRAGRLDEAFAHANYACTLDDARPEAFNELGIVMQFRNEVREALKYFDTALQVDPSFSPAATNKNNLSRNHGEGGNSRYDLGL